MCIGKTMNTSKALFRNRRFSELRRHLVSDWMVWLTVINNHLVAGRCPCQWPGGRHHSAQETIGILSSATQLVAIHGHSFLTYPIYNEYSTLDKSESHFCKICVPQCFQYNIQQSDFHLEITRPNTFRTSKP